MAFRPLLLSVAVGIAALGAFHAPAAKATGYISINVGTSAPHHRSPYRPAYRSNYGARHDPRYSSRYSSRGHNSHHRAGYTFVPGHWAYGQRGRVWVPDQYVRVQSRYHSGYDRRYDHRYDRHDHRRHDTRVIYRSPLRPDPLPGAFYEQRGGD